MLIVNQSWAHLFDVSLQDLSDHRIQAIPRGVESLSPLNPSPSEAFLDGKKFAPLNSEGPWQISRVPSRKL